MLGESKRKAITIADPPTIRATGTHPMAVAQSSRSYHLTIVPRRTLRRIVAAAGALALVGSHDLLPVSWASAQAGQLSAPIAQPLTQGTVVERALGAGERHRFSIDLADGDFVHAVIDQRDVDVTVFLFG